MSLQIIFRNFPKLGNYSIVSPLLRNEPTEPQPPEPTAEKVNPKIEEPNLITFDDPSSSKFVQPPPNPAVLQGMFHDYQGLTFIFQH